MPNRSENSSQYRFGFGGQEKDDEISGNGNSINYKFRMYDPRIARFFAVDPLEGNYPYWTPYQFAGLMPIRFVELEGLEPGEPFETKTEAALNFSSIYGTFSIQEDREYSATIYSYTDKNGDTHFSYTNPHRGSKSGAIFRVNVPKKTKAVAGIHSHGAYSEFYFNNVFSDTDILTSEQYELSTYVTTPKGQLKLYDPATADSFEEVRIDPTLDVGKNIDNNSPSDPNDPDQINSNSVIEKGRSKQERKTDKKNYKKQNKSIRKEYKVKNKEILKTRKS